MFTNPVHVAELAAVLGAIAIVLVRWLPGRARRTATTVAGASVVLTALAVFLFGARWQMYPVLIAALIALAFAVPTIVGTRTGRRARRAPWWLALPGSLACLALIVAGGGAAWALPVPAFPQPSGGFTVGTTTLQWTDADRDEPETPDPADHRTIVAQLWYPAEPATGDADPAPYLGRTRHEADIVSAGVADYLGVPAFVLDSASRASTHSFTDVAPARGNERFPVVLFSPGLGGVRGQNTLWAEELASRGYVVIALDHPYDSAAVVLDDGRTVRTRVSATGDAAEDEKRAVSWTATRAADLSFTLTRLGELDRGRIKNPFTARLDTSRVAVTGHSLGGAAALRAARQDPRFASVINLDGGPHDPDPRPFHQPVLVLAHPTAPGENDSYIPKLTAVLELSSATTYLLTVPGSAHLTFTDAPLYLPPLPSLAGDLGRTEGPTLTAALSAAFLDTTLRGTSNDIAATLAKHGTLTTHVGARTP